MGCRSDYLEPTRAEEHSKNVAQHLIYVLGKLNKNVSQNIVDAASNIYGNPKMLNEMVVQLCEILTNLDEKLLNKIVYNAKDKNSRSLADWWEEHQKADNLRIAKENSEKNERALAKKAKSKLTEAEINAIKKYG